MTFAEVPESSQRQRTNTSARLVVLSLPVTMEIAVELLEELKIRDKLVGALRNQEHNFEQGTCIELTMLLQKEQTFKVRLAISMLEDELEDVWCQTDDAVRGV